LQEWELSSLGVGRDEALERSTRERDAQQAYQECGSAGRARIAVAPRIAVTRASSDLKLTLLKRILAVMAERD
jgi:hypothetical protein